MIVHQIMRNKFLFGVMFKFEMVVNLKLLNWSNLDRNFHSSEFKLGIRISKCFEYKTWLAQGWVYLGMQWHGMSQSSPLKKISSRDLERRRLPRLGETRGCAKCLERLLNGVDDSRISSVDIAELRCIVENVIYWLSTERIGTQCTVLETMTR